MLENDVLPIASFYVIVINLDQNNHFLLMANSLKFRVLVDIVADSEVFGAQIGEIC